MLHHKENNTVVSSKNSRTASQKAGGKSQQTLPLSNRMSTNPGKPPRNGVASLQPLPRGQNPDSSPSQQRSFGGDFGGSKGLHGASPSPDGGVGRAPDSIRRSKLPTKRKMRGN